MLTPPIFHNRMCIIFTCYVIGLSFNAFFPGLTGTLGFDYVPTLLMSSPPWAFSCIVSLINAWHSDKTQEKVYHFQTPKYIRFGFPVFLIVFQREKSGTDADNAHRVTPVLAHRRPCLCGHHWFRHIDGN